MKTLGGRPRAALLAGGALIAALALVSGDDRADPRTPSALPGLPPPFLGVAVLGDGGLTAAVDAYGNVVDLRPEPAGRALIENPADRQAAGTVEPDTGIQVWVRVGGETRPMWQADSVRQRYLPGTNVLRTVARFGEENVAIEQAVLDGELAILARGGSADTELRVNAPRGIVTRDPQAIAEAAAGDRRWLSRAQPLAPNAPKWAQRMYERSLLVLHALTGHNGAVAAGAREGWAYVWPRDASAAAIAFAAAGYREEAERIAQFMLGLGLEHAARFHGDGSPVAGRAAQGDAIGWVAAASRAAGIGNAGQAAHILAGGQPIPWRDRADYWEGEPGDYLGNAIASRTDVSELSGHIWRSSSDTPSERGLVREAEEPDSGLDSAAAWAVRPFSMPRLHPAVRATLNRLVARATPYGITPGEGWPGGEDPWSAPTAWTAWSLAALDERRQALRLMEALRHTATPAGALPERVDARTGIPRSTTPLVWSHAFAILALRELWPVR
jgi:hypothetical protein